MNLELMSNSKARRILTHVPVILTYIHSPVSKPHQTDGGSAKTPHFDRVQVLAHSISDRKKTKNKLFRLCNRKIKALRLTTWKTRGYFLSMVPLETVSHQTVSALF